MNIGDIKFLLGAISRTLGTIKEFPVLEDVIEDGSYDLTIGDAIQALDEVVQGIENINDSDLLPDLHLTPDLKEAIASLSELGTAIIQADTASRPCENKAAAIEVARQDGHDISRGECND